MYIISTDLAISMNIYEVNCEHVFVSMLFTTFIFCEFEKAVL